MQSDPLQQLRDVHLPPDPNWWPPAPGWWLLAAVVLAAVAWLIYRMVQAYQRRAPLRTARRLLKELLAAEQREEVACRRRGKIGWSGKSVAR